MNNVRVVQPEGALHELNESIEQELEPRAVRVPVLMRCECGRPDCHAFLPIRIADYEQVRAHARRFVIRDGHERTDAKTVLRRRPGYVIVETTGELTAV